MGYEGSQYVAVEHNDRQHQHLHIVLSRVRVDGSLVRHELGDFHKAMAVCRDLERQHGLRQVVPELGLHQATRDEYRDARRTGQPSERRRLQALVLAAVTGRPTLGEFVARLERQRVEVRLWRADDGPVLGISYRLDRYGFRGAALGTGFTWSGLARQGVSHDPVRDRALVERLSLLRVPAHAPGLRGAEDRVRKRIDERLAGRPMLADFVADLAKGGILVYFNVAQTGHVSGISYRFDGRTVKGSALGRAYSWHNLKRRGLDYDPTRDEELVRAFPLRGQAPAGPSPIRPMEAAEELAAVREVLRASAAGRPTLTDFVERVESHGVGVRLYRDWDHQVHAIGFKAGRVSINAHELGETFTWQGVQGRGVDYDPDRDRQAVERVGYALANDDPRWPDILGAARNAARVARSAKRRLDQVAEIVEDPLSGLARVGGEMAMRAALRALSEGLLAAGRATAQRLARREDELVRVRDRELLASAREGRHGRVMSPPGPPPLTGAPTPGKPADRRMSHEPPGEARGRPPDASGPFPSQRPGPERPIAHARDAAPTQRLQVTGEGPRQSVQETAGQQQPTRAIDGDARRPAPVATAVRSPVDRGTPDAPSPRRDVHTGAPPSSGEPPGRPAEATPALTPTERFEAAAKALRETIAEGRRQSAERALESAARLPSALPPGGRSGQDRRQPDGLDVRPPAGRDADRPVVARPAIGEPVRQQAAAAPPLTPIEGLYKAARALRESIDESIRASEARLAAAGVSAVARHAPVAGAILQETPGPGRVRELAENPEKALVVGAATAVSAIRPAAAPAVTTAARVVEKLIDQARDLDSDGRTR